MKSGENLKEISEQILKIYTYWDSNDCIKDGTVYPWVKTKSVSVRTNSKSIVSLVEWCANNNPIGRRWRYEKHLNNYTLIIVMKEFKICFCTLKGFWCSVVDRFSDVCVFLKGFSCV